MEIPKFINFGGADIVPSSLEEAKIVILPICYEQAPSYGLGSKDGAFYLLEASSQIELIDEETFQNLSLLKIYTHEPIFPDLNNV